VLYIIAGLFATLILVRESREKAFRHEISELILIWFAGLAFPVYILLWPLLFLLDYLVYRYSLRKTPCIASIQEHDSNKGERGICLTELKPSGKIRIGDNTYDATAINKFLEKDSPVVVVGKEGFSLLVKRRED